MMKHSLCAFLFLSTPFIRSEVATVDWIRHVTNIPTPRIIAYNATRESEIGFEWILMTEVSGKPLADLWQYLSVPCRKVRLGQEIRRIFNLLVEKSVKGDREHLPTISDGRRKNFSW